MSRTYRTHLEYNRRALGRTWTWEEERAYLDELGIYRLCRMGWNAHPVINRKSRDRKAWDKPPSWFKKMKRRIERSREKAALRLEKDIPEFHNSDQWDWT